MFYVIRINIGDLKKCIAWLNISNILFDQICFFFNYRSKYITYRKLFQISSGLFHTIDITSNINTGGLHAL